MGERIQDVMSKGKQRAMVALAMKRSGMTYRQVGEAMGVCSNRARQLCCKAERLEGTALGFATERYWAWGGKSVERLVARWIPIDGN